MRGQHSIKILGLFVVFSMLFLPVFAATPLAAADSDTTTPAAQTTNSTPTQCQPFKSDGYLFDNYETHDYLSGFLAVHLRLKQPYNDGRVWNDYGIFVYNQACSSELQEPLDPHASIDPGVQLYSVRFSSPTHYDLWNDELNIREQCPQCSGDIVPTLKDGEAISSVAFYASIGGTTTFVTSDSFTILPPQPVKTPVLIIPGILGTELSYSGTKIWPNVALSAITDDSFLDPLEMDTNGQPISGINVGNVISSLKYGLGTFDYAQSLATGLEQQGYVGDSSLFFFPYDWRKDPQDLEAALQTEINHIAALNPDSPKIDIVAHSYGGLLLKRYILQTSDPRLGKIIFVGVPHLGTPQAAQALIFGDDLGTPILNSQEIFKIAQNMPMIYDLLPGEGYYDHTAGFFDDLTNIKTPVIMGYGQAINLLLDMGKNLKLLNQAQMSHTTQLDDMDFSKLPYQVSSIVGCGVFTEKTINKMYNGDPTIANRALWGPKYRIEGDSGDGSVVIESAAHDSGSTYYVSGIKHAQLLSNPTSLGAIISLLNGQVPDPSKVHTQSTIGSSCDISGKMLSFSSNVNLVLTNRSTGAVLVPRQDYSVIQTGNDQHIFISDEDLPTYAVQVKSDVPGGAPESVSIGNVTTNSGANHNTYNYNNLDLNGNSLGITFPKAADGSNGQDVENIDPTTGDITSIPPSTTLDGSYNDTDPPATTTTTTTTSTTSTDTGSTSPTNTYIPPTNDSSDPSQTITPIDSSNPDNSESSDTGSDGDDSSSDQSSTDVGSTPKTQTLHSADGDQITINVNAGSTTPTLSKSVGAIVPTPVAHQVSTNDSLQITNLFVGIGEFFEGMMRLFFHILF